MSSTIETLTYNELRSEGQELIEKYSHKNWTDYNIHDPGITLMEYLSYALTDINYRTGLEMKDILAASGKEMNELFATAETILPCRSLTEKDYRKLLIDLPFVKNAWLQKHKGWHRDVFIDPKEKEITVTKNDRTHDLDIKGQYDVTIQFHESVSKENKEELLGKVWKKLHENRNLCEDFLTPSLVPEEPVGICFDLHVEPNADIDEVMSEAATRIDSFISPAIRFYTLSQMQDKGYSVEDIFNGPFLSHGFIDDSEIELSDLRSTIHASDLIQVLMDIPGIIAVNRLLMTSYTENGDKELVPLISNKRWTLDISDRKAPVFSLEKSRFIAYKNNVPYFADKGEVKYRMRQLKAREFQRPLLEHELVLKLPVGNKVDLKSSPTIQNHFPLVYGIGEEGLPDSATEKRKAEALQFKAYILILEQFLANYLAQLDKTASFFSFGDLEHTSWTQVPENIQDFKKLLVKSSTFANTLQNLAENEQQFLIRRNRFLDHLMARFNEEWHEYSILAEVLYGGQALERLKEDKKRLLKNYPKLSHDRAAAFNYLYPITKDKDHPGLKNHSISGLENRLRVFLDMLDESEKVFSFDYFRVYQEEDDDGIDEYRFEIFDDEEENLLSSTRHFHSKAELYQVLREALNAAREKGNYTVIKGGDNKFYLKVELDDDNDERALARKIYGFESEEDANAAIDKTIKFIKEHPPLNKLFVIEHSLFRPHLQFDKSFSPVEDVNDFGVIPKAPPFKYGNQDLLNACVDPKCVTCSHSDPYSFRISIVLPYAVKEFKDMNFRRFLERYIREQTPAHILAKICWIDSDKLYLFDRLYKKWQRLMSVYYTTGKHYKELMHAQRNLIKEFKELSSVYPVGYLHDCTDDEQKRPITLGQSKLGTFDDENVD